MQSQTLQYSGLGLFSKCSKSVYRFSTLPDDSASSERGNIYMSLKLNFFLGSKEILFLQFAKDATLSLRPDMIEYRLPRVHFSRKTKHFTLNFNSHLPSVSIFYIKKTKRQQIYYRAAPVSCFYLQHLYIMAVEQHLKLSFWWSNNDDHPLFGIHSLGRGNLKGGRQHT